MPLLIHTDFLSFQTSASLGGSAQVSMFAQPLGFSEPLTTMATLLNLLTS